MKADNNRELQSASWRSKTADNVIPVQAPAGVRPGKRQCFRWRPKAGKTKVPAPAPGSQVGGVPTSSGRSRTFYSIQAFPWLGEAHPQ